jgi:hypothetical protein
MSMRELKIDDWFNMGHTTTLELVKKLKEMQFPQWSNCVNSYSSYQSRHSCPNKGTPVGPTAFDLDETDDLKRNLGNSGMGGTLNTFAAQLVQSVKHSLVGLELSDFVKVCPKSDMLF